MKKHIRTLLILIPFTFGACAPSERNEVSEVKTTYEPKRPVIVKEQGYNIARGATKIENMSVVFDQETKSMKLTGKVEYLRIQGKPKEIIEVDLAGVLDSEGYIALKPYRKDLPQKEGLIVAAKATCLSEEGTCHSSFVDIYLYTDGVVYHHQVESHQEVDKDDTDKGEADEVDDELESEGGADAVEGEPGQYVGSIFDDIQNILNVNPEVVKTKEEPKKDNTPSDEKDDGRPKAGNPVSKKEPKQGSASSDEKDDGRPKAGNPKTAVPKKEEPKKEEPKKADPKKEVPKKEEPKKETPKKEEPKKEEPKKEEPKKADPKKDEKEGQPDKGDAIPKPTPRPDIKDDKSKDDTDKKPEPAVKPQIQKTSQAIGAVNAGRLENAADLLKWEKNNGNAGYNIIRPQRLTHFATNELAYLIQQMGALTKKLIPGYVLAVGDMSREKGGKLGTHKSHTNGLDADVAFFFDNKTFQGFFASATAVNKTHANWMVEEQWQLYKHIVNTKLVDRIFIHKVLKAEICKLAIKNGEIKKGQTDGLAAETLRRLIADTDHNTHFHLRVKCSSAQVRCRQMAEPAPGSGCF